MNNTIAFKRSQLPANALFIGIDPHKQKHAVSVNTAQAQVLSKFKVSNDRTGFDELVKRCEQLRRQCGAEQVIFGIEPGAHYWRNLAYFLEDRQQTVRLVNPFTLKRQRDGDDLLRRKNDYRDAQMVAQLVWEGKYTWSRLPKERYAELRVAYETYQQCLEDETRVRQQLQCALDELFPEFQQVFKDLNGATARQVLITQANPHAIAALPEAEFVAQVAEGFQGTRLMRRKLMRLHAAASTSIGIPQGTQALNRRVQLLSDRLATLYGQRQEAEGDLVTMVEQFPESQWLLSMRGLGRINAAGLLAHIGDIQQYSQAKQLAKLAGVVPIENSSADHASGRTPMSKKGRKGLRETTWRAVASLLRHNPAFRKYVEALQDRPANRRPLSKRAAMGAAMNKLLRITYALLTKQQRFDPICAFAA